MKQSNVAAYYVKSPFANIKFEQEDQLSENTNSITRNCETFPTSPDFKNV